MYLFGFGNLAIKCCSHVNETELVVSSVPGNFSGDKVQRELAYKGVTEYGVGQDSFGKKSITI